MLPPSASVDAYLETSEGICALTHQALNVDQIIKSVGDHGAGATCVFIGTTRNSFKGGF
jgi:molybdopterin synthase catalytic subunit